MRGTTRGPSAPSPGPIGVTERSLRRDAIADELLELLELRKAPLGCTRPYHRIVELDLEHPLRARTQRDLGELALESDEELLGHPRRAEKPAAFGAVRDPDAGHAPQIYGLICTGVPSGTARQISSISWLDSATHPLVQSFWRCFFPASLNSLGRP